MKPTEEDLKEISDAVPVEEIVGSRTFENTDRLTWKFANKRVRGFDLLMVAVLFVYAAVWNIRHL